MTGHLTPDEQIDSLEGTLGPVRAAHLDGCRACRDDVARLRETFDAARRVDVPEPSPLFWQHQAARISELVAGESIQRPRSAWTRRMGWRCSCRGRGRIAVPAHGLAASAFFVSGGPSGPLTPGRPFGGGATTVRTSAPGRCSKTWAERSTATQQRRR